MHPSPDHPWLREKFRAPGQLIGGSARGFVCILDVRPARSGRKSDVIGHCMAWAALLALAALAFSDDRSLRPVPPLQPDDDALQLARWESPTDFLLKADFPPTPPN